MADRFVTDPEEMGLAGMRLRDAGRVVDATGTRAPATPQAGVVTGEMTAVLEHLVGSAGELAVGVTAAGEAVLRASSGYLTQDEAAARAFQGLR